MDLSKNEEVQIIILGSIGMIVLSLSIIVFFVLYQRKIQKQKNNMNQMEIEFQKNLVKSQIVSIEKERQRIAQELHDGIGSSLTSIKMSLNHIDFVEHRKTDLEEALEKTIQNVRRISSELLPPILEELGMQRAIQSHLRRLNQNLDIDISFNNSGDVNLKYSKEIELSIFRVIQELINNIIKYSECKHISVELNCLKNKVQIILEDDGKGFLPKKMDKEKADSHGLKNVYSRLQFINGDIDFSLLENGGTKTSIIKMIG